MRLLAEALTEGPAVWADVCCGVSDELHAVSATRQAHAEAVRVRIVREVMGCPWPRNARGCHDVQSCHDEGVADASLDP